MAATVAAALLVGSLGTAEAAGPSRRGGTDLWAQVQVWLRAQVEGITALLGADGSIIDPWGQPQAAEPPATTQGDGGVSVLWGAEGSIIDPWGQPHAAAPPVSTQSGDGSQSSPSGIW